VAKVVVVPEQFTLVHFDAGRIQELAETVADLVGLAADVEIRIEVEEQSPLGRVRVQSLSPVSITVQGGALEDAKKPRQLSDDSVLDVLGRVFHRIKDRLDPGFGDPPDDADLTLQQTTAWDAYCVGRASRLGLHPSKPRRLYHFRNRHGFTDVADATFERLWTGENLTWADLEAACAATASARQAV
jgi:hypothetical protein